VHREALTRLRERPQHRHVQIGVRRTEIGERHGLSRLTHTKQCAASPQVRAKELDILLVFSACRSSPPPSADRQGRSAPHLIAESRDYSEAVRAAQLFERLAVKVD
jgi:hypothetical protein